MDTGKTAGDSERTIPMDAQPAKAAASEHTGGDSAEELRRQLQRERVEQGRLAKANDEIAGLREQLRARDEEMADMRRQFDELRGRTEASALRDSLPEAVRDGVDSDILDASAQIAMRAGEKVRADMKGGFDTLEKRVARLETRDADTRARPAHDAVVRAVDEFRPDFIDNVATGGPWADAWATFLGKTDPDTGRPYRERLTASYDNGRADSVKGIVGEFLADSGLGREAPPPAPATAGAETDPGAGRAAGEPRRYTKAEFEAALRDASNRYYGGTLSRADYDKARAELDRALDEGRVA